MTGERDRTARVFLLSPAHCNGERARLVRNPRARFDLARRLQEGGGAELGEVFSFMSGLYFRGKLTYATAFAQWQTDVLVITPGSGLRPPTQRVTVRDLERWADVPVAPDEVRYRRPFRRDARALAERLPAGAEVVLLGSLATNKYLQVLAKTFGDRLRFPREFIGRGDMSRGALLLRSVRERRELEYVGAEALA